MFDEFGPAAACQSVELRQERMHPASGAYAIPRYRNDYTHFKNELEQIGPKDAPEAAERDIDSREWNQEQDTDGECLAVADAENDGGDCGHRFGHPAEDHAVHQKTEVDGAKPAKKRARFSGVAHLGEFNIRQ